MNFPSLGGNWVDLVILIVIIFFLFEAYQLGFWLILSDFASFLGSLLISLWGYQHTAFLLRANFSLSHSLSNALGFLLTAILAEIFLGYVFKRIVRRIPGKYWKKWWDKFLAILPGVGEALVLVAFVMTLVLGLPVSPKVKSDVTESKLGGIIVSQTTGLEARIDEIFGGVVEDSLTYLTVTPGSRESIPITVERRELVVDEVTEMGMFIKINEERAKKDIVELTWREDVVAVAREHAKDMWQGAYFGHVSPEGKDLGDRLDEAEVDYTFAGENLALAPTLSTAHEGLMKSPGHRDNILSERFKRLGIGVIDNGVYGKMFVQVFTD